MPGFVSNERRLVLRIMDYWEFLRGERRFPAVSDVNPDDLADDWKSCVLIDTGSNPKNWAFRHIGSGFGIPGSDTMSGTKWSEWDRSTFLGLTTSYISKVLEHCVPVSIGGEVDDGAKAYRYRSILLPLSEDGETVTGILGAANRGDEAGLGVLEAPGS